MRWLRGGRGIRSAEWRERGEGDAVVVVVVAVMVVEGARRYSWGFHCVGVAAGGQTCESKPHGNLQRRERADYLIRSRKRRLHECYLVTFRYVR